MELKVQQKDQEATIRVYDDATFVSKKDIIEPTPLIPLDKEEVIPFYDEEELEEAEIKTLQLYTDTSKKSTDQANFEENVQQTRIAVAEERMFPPDFNMDEQRVRKKFNLGTTNTEETQALKHLLEENIHLFTDNMNNLGVCTVLQHEIHTGDAIPIKQKPY